MNDAHLQQKDFFAFRLSKSALKIVGLSIHI